MSPRALLCLCGGLLLLQLVAVWSVPFVPTQDGPAHLGIAAALDDLLRNPDGPLGSYYALNRSPEPNLLSDVLLAGLVRVAGCEAGEKVLLSLLLILLPLAFVYCLRAVGRDSLHLAVLVLPLGMSYFFHMGFHNFCLAVPLSLFTLGFWLRHREAPSRRALAVFGLLLLATALSHALPAAVAMLAVAVLVVRDALREALREDRGTAARGPARLSRLRGSAWSWGRAFGRRAFGPAVAGLPAALLLLALLAADPRQPATRIEFATLLKRMVLLQPMISYDRWEHLAAAVWGLVVGSLVVLALVRRVRRRDGGGDGLLLVAAALVVLYFAMPAGVAGGGYVNPRLQLFALLFGLLWLAARGSGSRERHAVVAAGTAVSLALLALHFAAYVRLSGPLEEYASVQARLPRGAAVLPVSYLDEPALALDPALVSYKIRPYEHAVGYLACERPLVDLANYQADQGYFAIVYREPRNPYSHLYAAREGRCCRGGIDLAGYESRGGTVDAVLLWGRRYSARGDEAEALLDRLGDDYTLAFTSRPRGLAELYVRRPLAVAATP